MKIQVFVSLLGVLLLSGCKKEPVKEPDYSQALFESGPDWERVGIVPWQEPREGQQGPRYILGDLQFSPTGQLLFAYAQKTEDAWMNGIASTAYLASMTPGTDEFASISPTGFTIKASEDAPLFFQQPSENKVFVCIANPGHFKILRSDNLAATSMGIDLADLVGGRFRDAQMGPRYMPRYHAGTGDLLFNNDQFGAFYTTELYNTRTNSWLEVHNPATSKAGNDWVSYQTSDGTTGYSELQVIRDSIFLAVYQLNSATRQFDSVSAKLLPEFSGKGTAGNCRILSYNDEEELIVAVARFENRKPLEASVSDSKPFNS